MKNDSCKFSGRFTCNARLNSVLSSTRDLSGYGLAKSCSARTVAVIPKAGVKKDRQGGLCTSRQDLHCGYELIVARGAIMRHWKLCAGLLLRFLAAGASEFSSIELWPKVRFECRSPTSAVSAGVWQGGRWADATGPADKQSNGKSHGSLDLGAGRRACHKRTGPSGNS